MLAVSSSCFEWSSKQLRRRADDPSCTIPWSGSGEGLRRGFGGWRRNCAFGGTPLSVPNTGLSDGQLADRWGAGLRAKGLLRPKALDP